ncbi:MAG: hypothetical protein ACR2IQ_02680 [Minisyncoccia bacterium]
MKQIKSAIISALLVAIIATLGYITTVGSIWKIDWRVIIDVGVMSLTTGLASILKNLLTTGNGKFLGIIKHQ